MTWPTAFVLGILFLGACYTQNETIVALATALGVWIVLNMD